MTNCRLCQRVRKHLPKKVVSKLEKMDENRAKKKFVDMTGMKVKYVEGYPPTKGYPPTEG